MSAGAYAGTVDEPHGVLELTAARPCWAGSALDFADTAAEQAGGRGVLEVLGVLETPPLPRQRANHDIAALYPRLSLCFKLSIELKMARMLVTC